MLRKQFYISDRHVQRLEALCAELGVESHSEVVRRAIEVFDPNAPDQEERELIRASSEGLRQQVADLNERLNDTIEQVHAIRHQINDPDWVESVRARTRRRQENDPALLSGVSRLIGA